MAKIRVLVVDDHTLVRDGITALLQLAPDIEVVGEASDGKEALAKTRDLKPDVVLMDLEMPVMDGLEASRRICARYPEVMVLVLSQYQDANHVLEAIEAGVKGFVNKNAASAELAVAIRSVYRGESFLSPPAARLLIDRLRRAERGLSADPYEELTPREKEILKLIAEGKTTRQIADALVISPKTVEGHRTRLMAKLGVHDRVELVKYAVRKGLISL